MYHSYEISCKIKISHELENNCIFSTRICHEFILYMNYQNILWKLHVIAYSGFILNVVIQKVLEKYFDFK